MPVTRANSDHHGRGNHVAIVWCPRFVGQRFVHFDRNPDTRGWVIRDYVSGWQLSSADSTLSAAEIEEAAERDEFPPFHPWEERADWKAYLELRSMAVSKQHGLPYHAAAAPNPASGRWRPL